MSKTNAYELTPQIAREICAYLRSGAFDHVAAEAAGIPAHIFEEWMRIGTPVGKSRKNWRQHKIYTPFFHDVMRAKAQARLQAELAALKDDPVAWLKHGPGKDRPNNPGWSTTVRPVIVDKSQHVNVLTSPELAGVFASLLQVLEPYPEARAAVGEAISGGMTAPRMLATKPVVLDNENTHASP